MNKFKEFLKKICSTVYKFFKSDKFDEFMSWFFPFVLGVYIGGTAIYINLYCNNSCSSETISTCDLSYNIDYSNYEFNSDYTDVSIQIGDISQTFVSFANDVGSNFSVYYKTISLPLVLHIEDMDNFGNMKYRISFGGFLIQDFIPDNGVYYKNTDLSLMARQTQRTNYISNELDYGYSYDGSYTTYNYGVIARYKTNDSNSTFGFELPEMLRRDSSTSSGVATSYYIDYPGTTYFMFATNRGDFNNYVAPTRLSSLYIDYWEYSNSINNIDPNTSVFLNNQNVYLYYWVTYNFTFDNGLKVAFGLPYYSKFPNNPNNIVYEDIYYSYYDEGIEGAFNNGFSEGYLQGEAIGYNKGVNESLEDVSPFEVVKSFVNSLLNIKLFGDLSLGVILSVIFGFITLGILLKVFLGG